MSQSLSIIGHIELGNGTESTDTTTKTTTNAATEVYNVPSNTTEPTTCPNCDKEDPWRNIGFMSVKIACRNCGIEKTKPD